MKIFKRSNRRPEKGNERLDTKKEVGEVQKAAGSEQNNSFPETDVIQEADAVSAAGESDYRIETDHAIEKNAEFEVSKAAQEETEVSEIAENKKTGDSANAVDNMAAEAEITDENTGTDTAKGNEETKTEKKKRRFLCFPAELLAFQAFCEIYCLYRLSRTDMLPGKYLLTAAAILGVLFLIPALLLLIRRKKASRKRILTGTIISLLIVALSAGGSYASMKAGDTMRIVSVSNKDSVVSITSEIGVYVLKDDPAEKLKDMRNYKFSRVKVIDQENTEKAIRKIEDKLNHRIDLEDSDSIENMLDSLYDGKVQAIILNTAFVNLLGESEEFVDLQDKIRPVKTMQIQTAVELSDNAVLSEEAKVVTEKPFIMYLSGSDTRNMTLATSGSDVNILMMMDPVNRQVLLLNTPRDSYIPNPAGKGAKDKLTHCGYYGVNNSIGALADYYDIDIDYYAQINFTGVKKLVDAIGGVTVYSDTEFSAEGYTFVEGDNEMDGDMALVFSRDRYHQADGDNARGRHQMAVIKAMLEKLLSDKSLLVKYPEIMNSLQGMFVTDMSTDSITAIIRNLLDDVSAWNIQSYALVGPNGMAKTYSMPGTELSVIYPTQRSKNHAKELIRMLVEGEQIAEEDTIDD